VKDTIEIERHDLRGQNFLADSVNSLAGFDLYRMIKFGMITQVEDKQFLGVQPHICHKGAGPIAPKNFVAPCFTPRTPMHQDEVPICNGRINQVKQMLRKTNLVMHWQPPDFLFTTKILRMKPNVLISNVGRTAELQQWLM